MSKGMRSVWLSEEEFAWIQSMREARKCASKQGFDTQALAEKIAALQMAKDPGKPDLFTYQCKVCRKFHLTKKPQASPPPKPKPIAQAMQNLTPSTDERADHPK